MKRLYKIVAVFCVALSGLLITSSPGSASATSVYDSLLKVSPTLYVYTDGAAKTQTMDISSSWWTDFQQTYALRVAQDIGWPTDFVSRFDSILSTGGSWGVFMTETPDGNQITIIGTHDPHASCSFSGPTSTDGFICSSSPSYDSLVARYFTYNTYGGNGCIGSGMYVCSTDGMNDYQAPSVQTSGGLNLRWHMSELPNTQFYQMHFNIQYPDGYGGARIPTGPVTKADPQYVAMGDSFSSGEGVEPFTPESSTGLDACHRSTKAYSQVLPSLNPGVHQPDFVACSGAVTADLYSKNHSLNLLPNPFGSGFALEPAQMNALDSTTKLVTLTIGGNDLGFAGLIAGCISPPFPVPGWQDPHCQNSDIAKLLPSRLAALSSAPVSTTSSVPTRTTGADGTPIYGWQQIIRDIHAKAPSARIEIAGYPELIDPQGLLWIGKRCFVGLDKTDGGNASSPVTTGISLFVYKDEANWMAAQVRAVNNALKTAVANSGVVNATYVPVDGVFKGHSLCDVTGAWINEASAEGAFTKPLTFSWPGSFHPNADGQSNGYAVRFAAGLPAGF